MMIDLSRRSIAKAFTSICAAIGLCLGTASTANAETIIRYPGQHPQYVVELEPHLALDWLDTHYAGSGIGPGMHAAIPIMHQGPITTINNNMAIKLGLDLTFGGGCNYYWDRRAYPYGNGCNSTSFLVPVALQWNFYITDIITTFGEVGMAIRYVRWSYDCGGSINAYCPDSHGEMDPIFYPAVGAKFMFGRTVGLTVRMGYPHFTLGASILI
jgi:hypothetical protein